MINFKEYTRFLIAHSINERQFTLLYYLYLIKQDKDAIREMRSFIEVHGIQLSDNKRSLTTQIDKDLLIEKGWLLKGGMLGYTPTDKFESIFVTTYVAGQEFIVAYPGFSIINGKNIPLKNSDRSVVRSLYANAINHNLAEHKRVLLDLEFGKANELITVNIENFVRSEGWWDIRERREQNVQTGNVFINDEDF